MKHSVEKSTKKSTKKSIAAPLAAICTVAFAIFAQTTDATAQKKKPVPKETQFTSKITPLSIKATAQCKKTAPLDDESGHTTSLRCAGAGDYTVYVGGDGGGYDGGYNYGAAVQNLKLKSIEYILPVGGGNTEDEENENGDEINERATSDATKYASSEYVQKLGDKIEWILADGKPVAFITSVTFYQQDPNVVFKMTAKNKAAEFVLVRGLSAYAELQEDLDRVGSAFNVDEQARAIVYKFVERRGK